METLYDKVMDGFNCITGNLSHGPALWAAEELRDLISKHWDEEPVKVEMPDGTTEYFRTDQAARDMLDKFNYYLLESGDEWRDGFGEIAAIGVIEFEEDKV